MSDVPEQELPKGRGFASMTPEKKREVASKGGKTAHAMGVAYKWDHDAAVEAGKKGGAATAKVYAQRIRERLGELSDE